MASDKYNNNGVHRVVALLNRKQIDLLDKIGKDALFSTGTKLARTEIISAMINVLKRLNVGGEHVSSHEELEEKIFQHILKIKDEG